VKGVRRAVKGVRRAELGPTPSASSGAPRPRPSRGQVLPFESVIDYSRFTIRVPVPATASRYPSPRASFPPGWRVTA
jgi:hypothetical protein